jgi:signal transduction histidine kinase
LRTVIWLLLVLAPILATAARADAIYESRDTRELVTLVNDAAARLQADGDKAFAEFSVPGSRWLADEEYLYIYDAEGNCLFNAGQPQLVGKNLLDYRDVGGRPVVRQLMDIINSPEADASGWIFFLFQQGNVLSPVWKSAYNRKVRLPDGRTVVVGSGRPHQKMERAFVTGPVDEAAALIVREGEAAAFGEILNPASRFNFLDTYVFVLDADGHTLADPAFPNMPGRDLSNMTDAIGRPYIRELLDELVNTDSASTQFLWRENANELPQRKAIYARKAVAAGKTYIVVADYLLPTPIWMK